MQRRLTIALMATALISILLVGFGVLAMAQVGARSRAEDQVTRGLNVVADFIDSPNRSARQVESLLFGSRANFGLRRLEAVKVTADGTVTALDDRPRRGPAVPAAGKETFSLDEKQLSDLDRGVTVLIPIDDGVIGLRNVPTIPAIEQTGTRLAVLAEGPVTAVSGQTVAWFLLSSAVVLAGAVLAGSWLARRLTDPIKDIEATTAAIAAGDLGARVDITGTDEVADLGREVNRMATDLQRSKALDRQFLMSVSHDLKTPLTAIAGYAEALSDGAVTNPRAAGDVIGNHAARLDRLVGDLLDLARLDANRFRLNIRPFDLGILTGRTVAGLTQQARHHGLVITREGLPGLGVMADSDRTAQAIGNLIDNAIKFARSEIRVEIGVVEGAAVVAVRDDGPGIAPEDLPHIFDRLYTGRAQPERAESPTGLGLAIVRELAHAMGGEVSASNNAGGGACLSLSLPLELPRSDAFGPAAATRPPPRPGTDHRLIAPRASPGPLPPA